MAFLETHNTVHQSKGNRKINTTGRIQDFRKGGIVSQRESLWGSGQGASFTKKIDHMDFEIRHLQCISALSTLPLDLPLYWYDNY